MPFSDHPLKSSVRLCNNDGALTSPILNRLTNQIMISFSWLSQTLLTPWASIKHFLSWFITISILAAIHNRLALLHDPVLHNDGPYFFLVLHQSFQRIWCAFVCFIYNTDDITPSYIKEPHLYGNMNAK